MALNNMFGEVDKMLDKYGDKSYDDMVAEQSKMYTTEMYYTPKWTAGVLVWACYSYMRKKGVTPRAMSGQVLKDMKNVADVVCKSLNVKSRWVSALTNQKFTVVTAEPDPIDLDGTQVQVENRGSGVVLIFYQSYGRTAPGLYAAGKHLFAQTNVFRGAGKQMREGLVAKGYGANSSAVGPVKAPLRGFGGNKAAPVMQGKTQGTGSRLHGGTPQQSVHNTGTNRSDTTVRMMNFLQSMQARDFNATINHRAHGVEQIKREINRRFNVAYVINGMSKIDIFNIDEALLKTISIKIVFGTASQNALQREADSGLITRNEKSLDGFFKKLESEIRSKFSNPRYKGSLSILDMAERGVFAKVPLAMKTASGLPDLRFKINKELVKKAKYKEKQKKAKARQKSKAKTKKLSVVAATSRGAPKAQGRRTVEKAKTAQSPLHLQAMLEAQLPQVVASKMGQGGALVYRSGRFANSVEPAQVMVGPRGGVQVDYTYMKMPYQTFEPGYKQGSTARDPRKIIGDSVREIAQSIIGDKFLKVRRV
jgi:hypothetical protein